MINAIVIADSISHIGGRLATLEVVMPRIILAEFNTHRVFSRNSASSRAIPFAKMVQQVMENPYVPARFGKYNTGMQPAGYLEGAEHVSAVYAWLGARDSAVTSAVRVALAGSQFASEAVDAAIAGDWGAFGQVLDAAGGPVVAKETVNRLLEPFMWTKVIVSSTEWDNFFNLRCHPDAQHDIRDVAEAIQQAMLQSKPNAIAWDEWHIPYSEHIDPGLPLEDRLLLSASACARVSYDKAGEPMQIERARSLAKAGHWSPFEHQATPQWTDSEPTGNFVGWVQQRSHLERAAA